MFTIRLELHFTCFAPGGGSLMMTRKMHTWRGGVGRASQFACQWRTVLQQTKPTSLVLYHCLFDNYGIESHRSYSFDLESYIDLPDLYAICAIDELTRPEKMVGALIIKT